MKTESPRPTETAIFAAGCFWGVEEIFRTTPGVIATEAGYTGGTIENPSYEQVCSSGTGHAEAVKIVFDPSQVSFGALLKIFYDNHNPTCLNYQGPDFGSQYRSAVFFTTPEQQKLAENVKAAEQASGKWTKPVVTEIVPASAFYPAEDYHQKYLLKRGLGSCHL